MKLCNLNITEINRDNLLAIEDSLQVLIPLNAECMVKSNETPGLLDLVNEYRTTIDGQIPLWLFKRKHNVKDAEKISGSDVVYDFCEWARDNGLKVFFLGGKETSNKGAVSSMKNKYPGLSIEGYCPPFEPYPFSEGNESTIMNKISSFQPDIIFIGFGFGKQERWVHDHVKQLNEIGLKWAVCSGGTFEFISGELKRAPKAIQKIGLEGVWRLIMEPKWFRVRRLLTSLRIFKYS